jgi:putative membrane protein
MRSSTLFSAGMVAVTMLALGVLRAQSAGSADANRIFMNKAMQGDLAEIQIGKLAQQKGTNDKVKRFGEKLVADHGANLEKAKSVAQSMGVIPPTAPNAAQKASYDRLNKLSGSKFDRKFAAHMVRDHKKDIKEFRHESKKSGASADFARQTAPKLRQHLRIAESLVRSAASSAR